MKMSKMSRTAAGVFLSLLTFTGCDARNGKVEATGNALLDGKPLASAVITFHPLEGTAGPGGFGATDAEGKFAVLDPQGQRGILPGQYKLTVTRLPTTAPTDEKAAIVEGLRVRPFPPAYSDVEKTTLKADVVANGPPIELRLESTR